MSQAGIEYISEIVLDTDSNIIQAYNIPSARPCGGRYDGFDFLRNHSAISFSCRAGDDTICKVTDIFYWASSFNSTFGRVNSIIWSLALIAFYEDSSVNARAYLEYTDYRITLYPSPRFPTYEALVKTLLRQPISLHATYKPYIGLFKAIGEIKPCHAAVLKEAETARAMKIAEVNNLVRSS